MKLSVNGKQYAFEIENRIIGNSYKELISIITSLKEDN